MVGSNRQGDRRRHDALDAGEGPRRRAACRRRERGFPRDSAESLPVDDGWADVVICNGVLNLLPDKDAGLREIARVLAPGGRLHIGDILIQQPVPEAARLQIDLWTG